MTPPELHPELRKFMHGVAAALKPHLLSKKPSQHPMVGASPPQSQQNQRPGKTGKQGKKPGRRPSARNGGGGFLERYGDYRVKDAYQDGEKAWRFIKEYLNVEQKNFDATGMAVVVPNAGTILNLSNIAQGSDYNNRDGNSILVQKLKFNYRVTLASSAAYSSVRILLLRDELHNAATDPVPSDVLESVSTTLSPLSPLLHIHDDNRAGKRFRILLDEVTDLNPNSVIATAGTSAGTFPVTITHRHEIRVGSHTMFQGSSGADASDWVGALYLMAINDNGLGNTFIDYYSRVYFTDN